MSSSPVSSAPLPTPAPFADDEVAAERSRIQETIQALGPRAAFEKLSAENAAEFLSNRLDNGRELARFRTLIHTVIVADWLERQAHQLGYDQPFALAAIGGTGRLEMTPCSDTDFAMLYEEDVEGNDFQKAVWAQTNSAEFEKQCGFSIRLPAYNLEHMQELDDLQLNAFLDAAPAYDPQGLIPRFRRRIQETYDPFAHFLHVFRYWRDTDSRLKTGGAERLDRFDIKNDGLRAFLAGVWALAGSQFQHSEEIYRRLPDPRDLEAYHFLLRIRGFVHVRRGKPQPPLGDGSHLEDRLAFDDFRSFGDLLGPDAGERERFEYANDVRHRLLAARRRVELFTRRIISKELGTGRPARPGSPIVHFVGGLRYIADNEPDLRGPLGAGERSEAALSLLLASQRYKVEIDPAELEGAFQNAGDWLELVPPLGELFYEMSGSLADSLEFLSQIDGALDRLFPGYGRFEVSLDERVMLERASLRGTYVREKLHALDRCRIVDKSYFDNKWRVERDRQRAKLEQILPVEASLLTTDDLAAIKLALVTKRLPLTPEDQRDRTNESLPMHERYASGLSDIPLEQYYGRFQERANFKASTVKTAEFLVRNRRLFKELSQSAENTDEMVTQVVELCQTPETLRALFVFTCVDRLVGIPASNDNRLTPNAFAQEQRARSWRLRAAEPTRWLATLEMYIKAMTRFFPNFVPNANRFMQEAGYSPREQRVLADFGDCFFAGLYARHANSFGSHLMRLADHITNDPKATLLLDGGAVILGIAARDFRGLAACIAGALSEQGILLRRANLFSARNHGLALDFFQLNSLERAIPDTLPQAIEAAVREQRHIAPEDSERLPPLRGVFQLDDTPSGNCRLRFETTDDAQGLLHAVTYKVYRHLGAGIHSLDASASRNTTHITIFLKLPDDLPLAEAQRIVRETF
ncbi:MAG: DUF294 nucleotidyltransferase-like domain-containing protein [Pirellulales bacterium]